MTEMFNLACHAVCYMMLLAPICWLPAHTASWEQQHEQHAGLTCTVLPQCMVRPQIVHANN